MRIVSILRLAFGMILVMTIITGLAYPLLITGIAEIVFPKQAGGSLIRNGDTVVGSKLIGQYFSQPQYFHPRPSFAKPTPDTPGNGYDAVNSNGSNLAPSSKKLVDAVTAAVQANQPDNPGAPVPGDLVTASASGLDPDISPAAADFQAPRVAKARGMTEDQVRALVKAATRGRTLGLFGEPRVNVLELNLLLDKSGTK